MSKQPDHFYINANIRNNEDSYQPAQYNEVRKKPILSGNVEDYKLSVQRFTISTNTIPVWIPHIDIDLSKNPSKNPNQTIYRISIQDVEDDSILATQPIIWKPQLVAEPTPSWQSPQAFTRYYYLYTIEHFVSLFNETLQGIPTATVATTPTLTFDDGKFSLYAGSNYHEGQSAQKYRLVLNEPLGELLNGFPVQRIQDTNSDVFSTVLFKSLGTNYLVENDDDGFTPIAYTETIPQSPYRLKMTQDRGSLAHFQVFRGVVFTTSSLPVRSEGVSAKTPFGFSTNQSISSTGGTESVLVDMDCVLDDSQMINQAVLQYQPKIEHVIDLLNASSIDTLQFNLYWKDSYGETHPLYLRHGSASVKFKFARHG